MKKYGIASIVGVLLVLFFASIMHPLNDASIGILTIICIGGCNAIATLIKQEENDEGVKDAE